MKKLGVFISHPIHYQTPLYRLLAKENDVGAKVYFYSNRGAKKYFDPQFKKEVILEPGLLDGYTYLVLPNVPLQNGFRFFSFINFGICTVIRKERFGAVLLNSWSYFSDWLVVFCASLVKTPVLLRAENPYNQEIIKAPWKLLFKKFILGKILFPRIHTFLYIGQENKRFYEFYGVPQSKLVFAPYCIDNERFSAIYEKLHDQKKELKRQLGIADNSVVILSLGSKLIAKKRPFDLLRAYGLVPSENKVLIFLGDGELRSDIERYIKEHNLKNVLLVGFQDQLKIPEFYALADIAVLPSGEGETWGLMVNEAMNFKLPVIVSDMVGCGKDLVHHGENGFVVRTGDIPALSGAISVLVDDPIKRTAFGEKSFNRIQHYTYNIVVDAVIGVLSRF